MFYEDPIRPDSFDAMARVNDRISIPLATGERYNSIFDFQTLLTREGRRLRAAVDPSLRRHHRGAQDRRPGRSPRCAGRAAQSPVAGLQLDAAIPNFAIQEYPTVGVGFEDKGTSNEPTTDLAGAGIVTNVPVFKDGFVEIPKTPGLGTKRAPGAAEAYPAFPRKVRMRPHKDGFIADQ